MSNNAQITACCSDKRSKHDGGGFRSQYARSDQSALPALFAGQCDFRLVKAAFGPHGKGAGGQLRKFRSGCRARRQDKARLILQIQSLSQRHKGNARHHGATALFGSPCGDVDAFGQSFGSALGSKFRDRTGCRHQHDFGDAGFDGLFDDPVRFFGTDQGLNEAHANRTFDG